MFITYYYEGQIKRDVMGWVSNTHLGEIKIPTKSASKKKNRKEDRKLRHREEGGMKVHFNNADRDCVGAINLVQWRLLSDTFMKISGLEKAKNSLKSSVTISFPTGLSTMEKRKLRGIPTERPPLVGEVSANFSG
jgi:hypothetical protein